MSANLFEEFCEPVGVSSATRSAWLEARRGLLTASDTAAIMGKDPYKSALDVWVDKVHPKQDKPLTIDDFAFWGLNLEQTIARIVSIYYDWDYTEGGDLLRSKAHPQLGCTLDGITKPPGEAQYGVYEGKTTSVFLANDWDVESAMPPIRVLIQAQHQLLVTGAPYAMVFCLIGGNTPRMVRVEPHADFHESIIQSGKEFLQLVADGIQPAPDHRSKTALDRLYPAEMTNLVVDLPSEAMAWTLELQEILSEIKRLEVRRDHIKNLLRATLGDAHYGRMGQAVGGKQVWKFGTIKRDAYEVAECSYRQLTPVKELPKALRNIPARMVLAARDGL